MRKFIILADITCDLSAEIREAFGITDYLPGHVHISDGRDFPTRLDWSEIAREDFYDALSNRKLEVTSAPPSPEEYYEKFRKYAEEDTDIISISISSKFSSTYNVACGAANRIREEFPGCDIRCIDSYRMSGAMGLLVVYAHILQKEGRSMDEICAWLEENKKCVHQMGPIDDLIFVARRGRLTMGKAIMGSFAGVKPMGDCNADGYVSVLARAKGIGRALDVTVRYLEKMASDVSDQYLIISHSNRYAYAEKLRDLITEKMNPKKVFISDVFSGCGTNIGPGMVAVYFMGEPISEDMVKEKEAMNELL